MSTNTDNLKLALSLCGPNADKCLECPYEKYGLRCIQQMSRDALAVIEMMEAMNGLEN